MIVTSGEALHRGTAIRGLLEGIGFFAGPPPFEDETFSIRRPLGFIGLPSRGELSGDGDLLT